MPALIPSSERVRHCANCPQEKSRQAPPRKPGVKTIFVNSYGRPLPGGGLTGSFNFIRDKAGISHTDEDGEIKAKHLHDVRGAFCTMLLIECDLTDKEVDRDDGLVARVCQQDPQGLC
ncbi:MAG: hypothetical protein ACO1NM_04895 [Sphingobium phenoxybenzoativorans]